MRETRLLLERSDRLTLRVLPTLRQTCLFGYVYRFIQLSCTRERLTCLLHSSGLDYSCMCLRFATYPAPICSMSTRLIPRLPASSLSWIV
ncbi:hypothetical protein CEXT_290011 [Caerostris extrusa]|uniref:Uncharacterized protein n=1 Tax=Caerostris extrusa TaxID=172846 RepID=A0AAV4MMR7_CAEEX|nr:hypothetical protein CEXT_290011 [Caerostris extrusa]